MKYCSILGKATLPALVLAALAQTAPAQTTQEPANKPAVAINRGRIDFVTTSAPVKILTETVKTSKPTDLLLSVTAECSIVTNVMTTGSQTQEAQGKLEVYITLDDDPNPIMPAGAPGPGHPRQADTAHVVFANQIYRRTTQLGSDDETDMINTYLETKHAAGFNWAVLNAQSGVHRIHVWARYTEVEDAAPQTFATGMIGSRSLIVQPVKCEVDETVVDETDPPVVIPIPLN